VASRAAHEHVTCQNHCRWRYAPESQPLFGRLRLCKSRRRSTPIRSRDRVAAFFPVVLSVGLPPVPPPPPLVGDFAQLPGSGYLMAGGNFLGRVISYVVNEVVVEGLANNRAFQRFAVRTSKAIEDVSTKGK
ncbi:unnamed protein product, partial [Musa acuminata var. zebrina]